MSELGHPTLVLTAWHSSLESTGSIVIRRVASISWKDFTDERSLVSGRRKKSLDYMFHFLVAGTIGRLFDFTFEVLAGSRSYGRWSWAISALPHAFSFCLRNRKAIIFATGGPASALLCGLVAKLFTNRPLFCEYQDPLIGSEIDVPPRAQKLLLALESALISNSTKSVFVTKVARDSAKKRNPKARSRVTCIYPGSWNFAVRQSSTRLGSPSEEIKLLHLGSLYSTRNLDLLFEAIDELKGDDFAALSRLKIINQGGLYVENASKYLTRGDFFQRDRVGREEALSLALNASFLLLVQHKDSRSSETIPYKLYDYLNLGIPVMGLVDNPELESLILDSGGLTANPNSKSEIKIAIRRLLSKDSDATVNEHSDEQRFVIKDQFLEIFTA